MTPAEIQAIATAISVLEPPLQKLIGDLINELSKPKAGTFSPAPAVVTPSQARPTGPVA